MEGRTFAKNSNIGKDTPDEAREMSDIDSRLAHMDELGVDTHVLYPTIFLRPLTRRPDAEVPSWIRRQARVFPLVNTGLL